MIFCFIIRVRVSPPPRVSEVSLLPASSGQDSNRQTGDFPELVLKPDPIRGYWAAPGDSLRLSCSSRGSQRTHELSMFLVKDGFAWNEGRFNKSGTAR